MKQKSTMKQAYYENESFRKKVLKTLSVRDIENALCSFLFSACTLQNFCSYNGFANLGI